MIFDFRWIGFECKQHLVIHAIIWKQKLRINDTKIKTKHLISWNFTHSMATQAHSQTHTTKSWLPSMFYQRKRIHFVRKFNLARKTETQTNVAIIIICLAEQENDKFSSEKSNLVALAAATVRAAGNFPHTINLFLNRIALWYLLVLVTHRDRVVIASRWFRMKCFLLSEHEMLSLF